MNKMSYEILEIDVISFEKDDIITSSLCPNDYQGDVVCPDSE